MRQATECGLRIRRPSAGMAERRVEFAVVPETPDQTLVENRRELLVELRRGVLLR